MYLRLNESGGSIAADSSGNGNDGTYESGVLFGVAGPLSSVSGDTAIGFNTPGTGALVTQSGSTLPSGAAPRTIEFWSRTADCQAAETVKYGSATVTNGQFSVGVNAGNCDPSGLVVGNGGGQVASWPLPAAWDDGGWHLYDVTYDGTTLTSYMDGQIVGSTPIAPLATVTPGDGFSVNAGAHPATPADVAEVAVYPSALSPARVDAHWTAVAATACATAPSDPYGQGVVADDPAVYFRLDDLVTNSTDRIAYDSSGHCTAAAPANATYIDGSAPDPDGVTLGYPNGAVSWGDTSGSQIVRQSGEGLPAANASRTRVLVADDRLPSLRVCPIWRPGHDQRAVLGAGECRQL